VRSALRRASWPPLQSSATSSGRFPFPAKQVSRVALNQPAHNRIIKLVFPDPVAPTMTMCRAHADAGRAKTGSQWWPIVRMVPPTGIFPPRASSGTAPGASVSPLAVRTCRFHCLRSKVIGAEAVMPPSPVVMA